MWMTRRLEQLRVAEHRKLRQALEAAGQALQEALRRRVEVPAPRVNLFGEPIESGELPSERVNLRPASDAFDPLERAITAHLDAFELRLAPMVRRWEQGEDKAADVARLAAELRSHRSRLEECVARMRAATRFTSELRAPMLALFSALEACDRLHEAEVLGVLLAHGPDSADSLPRAASSQDFTRRLRSSIDSEPDITAEPSLWQRLLHFLGRG